MREITVLIRRVQSGLPITEDESDALRTWIDFQKKANDKYINAWLFIFIIGTVFMMAWRYL